MSDVHTVPSSPPRKAPTPTPGPSAELAEDIERLRTEEQAKIERRRQEELARLRDLARFD